MIKVLAIASIICGLIVMTLTPFTGNYLAGVWAFNTVCWAVGALLIKEMK